MSARRKVSVQRVALLAPLWKEIDEVEPPTQRSPAGGDTLDARKSSPASAALSPPGCIRHRARRTAPVRDTRRRLDNPASVARCKPEPTRPDWRLRKCADRRAAADTNRRRPNTGRRLCTIRSPRSGHRPRPRTRLREQKGVHVRGRLTSLLAGGDEPGQHCAGTFTMSSAHAGGITGCEPRVTAGVPARHADRGAPSVSVWMDCRGCT
jgi:hypothetical protein